MVYGTFVFGYDHDGPEAIEAALDFALAQRLFVANFNPLTPTPGTPLYQRLRAEGRLLGDPWWLDPGFRYGAAQFRARAHDPGRAGRGGLPRAPPLLRLALHRLARPRSPGQHPLAWRAPASTWAPTWSRAARSRAKQGRALGG